MKTVAPFVMYDCKAFGLGEVVAGGVLFNAKTQRTPRNAKSDVGNRLSGPVSVLLSVLRVSALKASLSSSTGSLRISAG